MFKSDGQGCGGTDPVRHELHELALSLGLSLVQGPSVKPTTEPNAA